MTEEVLSYAPAAAILDVGYAQTPNTHLAGHGVKVYGVDLVEGPPEGYDAVYKCDLNTDPLPFKDGEIGAVTMGCVLAHVANPLKVLAEINRVLPIGGILVVSSPNPNYYWETVLNVFYDTFRTRVSKAKHIEHFFEFSRYNMRTSGERAGFKLEKEIGFGFWLVKTPVKFNPLSWPGFAYEIIYAFKKVGPVSGHTVFEDAQGLHKVPTNLYS